MRIENELKLGFDDVLIKPKRSFLQSRKQVNLEREYHFKHSPNVWTGVPIMISNMHSTGTFEMAVASSKMNSMRDYLLVDSEEALEEEDQDRGRLLRQRG